MIEVKQLSHDFTLGKKGNKTTNTGTIKEVLAEPEELSETTAATYEEVIVYANNLEAVKGVSDQLEEANYATYSVVSEVE
ncbi:hypothetical protein [Jeotgalibacillus soli]|uniref:Uncharacterized protein n=1 Tax=Jeotgalibacillus soli TaxID=889306 RepID=A0A0C2W5H0_9BACL|nr:hypothetical protein [Jeotgalibacillus soli]KIL51831.1 hypothetical protein KP78_02010 [Jeotgalibacillus soli]